MIIPKTIAIINCGTNDDFALFDLTICLIGLSLICLVLFLCLGSGKKRSLIKTMNDPYNFETDILGQPKTAMADRSNYKTIDSVISWRYILLILLLFLGLTLIYNDKVQYKAVNAAAGGYIIANPER